MGILRRVAGALLGATVIAGSAGAQISVDLRPATPGSDELVLTWAADPSVTGPFDLLRRQLPPGEVVADALPLDPVSDLYLTDFLSGNSLSRAQEAGGEPGVRVYQVVTASGGCSNLAYVIKHEGLRPGGSPQLVVSLPWRGGVRTLSGLLDDQPQLVGATT